MTVYTSKLIILRGNSGSGKSTVARKVREQSSRKIALVEQDVIRRGILKERETDDGANIALIAQIVEFALSRDYDVILEGILNFRRYGLMLENLLAHCPEHYIYYFDISFTETLRRHATKETANEFGETEMKQWYKNGDLSNFPGEKIIPETYTLEKTILTIIKDAQL